MTRRAVLGGLGALALGTIGLTGCSTLPGSLRGRIVDGLRDQGSDSTADIVAEKATELVPSELDALHNWQLVDVRNNSMSHPYRLYLGVTETGPVTVVVLSDFPERWPQLLDGAEVGDADQAVQVARTHFDVTRTMGKWCTRLDSFDDIKFVSAPDPDEVAALRERFGGQIVAPTAEPADQGWTMTLWALENDTELVERRTFVGADADVRVERTVHVDDLPVPISI